MNYKFPELRTIDDVLPHIQGRDEFIVAEREGYTVINYVVATSDTFPPIKVNGGSARMRAERALTNSVLRECRGLIFDSTGKLISRPFHKFFNVNEREETLVRNIDMTRAHVAMEKMDGSMIRPLGLSGHLRLATKMGVTEVAMNAETWLASQPLIKKEWLWFCMENEVTPLFEWTSRQNQIVLDYAADNLVLLACRHNTTGEYFMPNPDDGCPFDIVPQYGSVDLTLEDYVERQRQAEGREGDIIRFSDGHMIKIKNDWYVRIHKTLDRIRFDRHIVNLILHEEIDDVIPMLPQESVDRVRDFETKFWKAFRVKESKLHELHRTAWLKYQADRKRIALEFVPLMEHKADAQFIFRMIDGNTARELLLSHIEKNIVNNTKWEECAKWLEM